MWIEQTWKRRLLYLLAPMAPVSCSKYLFKHAFGRKLDLAHPKTLDEKIMWLKLNRYRHDPLVAQCADKWRVREYVAQKGLGEILNELYGVWDRPQDIPWATLPSSFVLKCNHASGFNILCQDKSALDTNAATATLQQWLDKDYWRFLAEVQYRTIEKKIIAERYLGDGTPLTDYKLYCFNGEPLYILACIGRDGEKKPRFYFFDPEWNYCGLTRDSFDTPPDFTLPRPKNLDAMLACARILSEPFPFVRADFYDVDGKLYFGELTFTPAAALDTARLPETDRRFGELLRLENAPNDRLAMSTTEV